MFWLEFINNPESKKIAERYQEKKVYAEARDAYYRAIADPEVQELLRIRDKAEKDYADALARRQEKGEKLGAERERAKADAEKRESAKKMLLRGLEASDIADIIGLSLDEINEIQKKVQ